MNGALPTVHVTMVAAAGNNSSSVSSVRLKKVLFLGLICLVITATIISLAVIEKETRKTDLKIHERLWRMSIETAKTDPYSKYAIYASRILAVKHPEIYLRGDAIFLKHITSHDGYRKAYLIKNVHDEYFYAQNLVGKPFSLNDLKFENYRLISFTEVYPENCPLFFYLDRRLFPIATTLKTWENKITQLELAVLFYFSLKENEGSQGLYIIYCDSEEAYVYDDNELIWMKNLVKIDTIVGNPILIFNEESVWYPLMGRDDTSRDPFLNNVVKEYSTDVHIPPLTEFEEFAIERLKRVTELSNENQILMATLVAAHTEGTGRGTIVYTEFRDIWDNLGIPQHAHGIFREIYKRANYLSPITAYLVWISQRHEGKVKVDTITNEYLKHARTPGWTYAHGHIWPCMLVGQTIDECYRTRSGHCIWQAASIAAVLTALNIDHVIIEGYNAVQGFHSWIYLFEYDLTISNGKVYNLDRVMFPPFFAVRYISYEGKWAHPILNFYIGTLSPDDLIDLLNSLRSIHYNDIRGLKQRSTIPYPELISSLSQAQWTKIELP